MVVKGELKSGGKVAKGSQVSLSSSVQVQGPRGGSMHKCFVEDGEGVGERRRRKPTTEQGVMLMMRSSG